MSQLQLTQSWSAAAPVALTLCAASQLDNWPSLEILSTYARRSFNINDLWKALNYKSPFLWHKNTFDVQTHRHTKDKFIFPPHHHHHVYVCRLGLLRLAPVVRTHSAEQAK